MWTLLAVLVLATTASAANTASACACFDIRTGAAYLGGRVDSCARPLGRITALKTFTEAQLGYTNDRGQYTFICGQAPNDAWSHMCCDDCNRDGCQDVQADQSGQKYDDASRYPDDWAAFEERIPAELTDGQGNTVASPPPSSSKESTSSQDAAKDRPPPSVDARPASEQHTTSSRTKQQQPSSDEGAQTSSKESATRSPTHSTKADKTDTTPKTTPQAEDASTSTKSQDKPQSKDTKETNTPSDTEATSQKGVSLTRKPTKISDQASSTESIPSTNANESTDTNATATSTSDKTKGVSELEPSNAVPHTSPSGFKDKTGEKSQSASREPMHEENESGDLKFVVVTATLSGGADAASGSSVYSVVQGNAVLLDPSGQSDLTAPAFSKGVRHYRMPSIGFVAFVLLAAPMLA